MCQIFIGPQISKFYFEMLLSWRRVSENVDPKISPNFVLMCWGMSSLICLQTKNLEKLIFFWRFFLSFESSFRRLFFEVPIFLKSQKRAKSLHPNTQPRGGRNPPHWDSRRGIQLVWTGPYLGEPASQLGEYSYMYLYNINHTSPFNTYLLLHYT